MPQSHPPLGLVPPRVASPLGWLCAAPMELPPGYVVGDRYRVERTLDITGATQLYRALDKQSGTPIKLKRLPVGYDDALTWREAEILAMLDHPRLPKGGEVLEEEGHLFFVQTYFEGPTLRQHFKKRGGIQPEKLLPLLADALGLLEYLHGLGPAVIHRDVKPANMVLLPDGRLALIDFDLASLGVRTHVDEALEDLTVAHTVGYAPPEQMIGREAYPASDLYALAASMIYVATNVHPIHQWNATQGRILVPERFPAPIARVLNWMLVPALADRCPSARAAMQRLEAEFAP